jgi:hypothetical protein
MKIVINSCYGGFGLSIEALYELYLKGCPIVEDVRKLVVGDNHTDEVIPFNNFLASFSNYHELRGHPDLIEIVEKLGVKADGVYADLKVVEIPDDVEWIITDNDGMETIEETHRTWN